MNEDEIIENLARYTYFHIIQLTDTIFTPGNPRNIQTQRLVLNALH